MGSGPFHLSGYLLQRSDSVIIHPYRSPWRSFSYSLPRDLVSVGSALFDDRAARGPSSPLSSFSITLWDQGHSTYLDISCSALILSSFIHIVRLGAHSLIASPGILSQLGQLYSMIVLLGVQALL